MTSGPLTSPSYSFAQLNLIDPLLRSLKRQGYESPTQIQQLAVPHVLAGKDLLGWAQTGTGKTAAFALPILQLLHDHKQINAPKAKAHSVRCLVLAPTRELAQQIGESFSTYGSYTGLKTAIVFGGVGMMPQVNAIRRGPDVVVATPGRLLDLMNQGYLTLNGLEIFVLDEADRMLDMGFIHDIRKVISKLPAKRQTLMFSATMAPPILKLAEGLLKNPVKVEVARVSSTAETVAQEMYFVEKKEKSALLKHLIDKNKIDRALVFTRTKHMANRVSEFLEKGGISSDSFHSNKSQGARIRALNGFKNGDIRILVCTDIAARGIDIDEISHVFNYDLPNEPEAYVHRIGSTGRAGATGQAMSFCSVDERDLLKTIERTIKKSVAVVKEHPYSSPIAVTAYVAPAPRNSQPRHPERRRPQAQKQQAQKQQAQKPQPQKSQSQKPQRTANERMASIARNENRRNDRGFGKRR